MRAVICRINRGISIFLALLKKKQVQKNIRVLSVGHLNEPRRHVFHPNFDNTLCRIRKAVGHEQCNSFKKKICKKKCDIYDQKDIRRFNTNKGILIYIFNSLYKISDNEVTSFCFNSDKISLCSYKIS